MNKKIKKLLYITLLLIFVGGNIFSRSISAQTVTPTDIPNATATPTDTPTPTIDPSATPAPTDTPTPTPDPSQTTESATVTPTPTTTTTDVSNNGQVTNNVTSDSQTGDNLIATPSATPTPAEENVSSSSDNSSSNGNGGGASISTGNAVSVATATNNVNSTSINSQTLFQTINIFATDGTIDLSTPFEIANNVIAKDGNVDPVVNVRVTGVHNYAYLSNDIVSIANTGANNTSGPGLTEAQIGTGNAISLVSLLNKVNFTLVGSTLHVVTINIFGHLNGNIILPDIQKLSGCNTCGMSIDINNTANVKNTVDSHAITGENTITSGTGTITTGDAQSTVNLTNIINTNIIGMSIAQLYINTFGAWTGNFLGWGDFLAQNGGGSLVFSNISPNAAGSGGCPSCTGDVSINNSATVDNNISSRANTGGNSVQGNGNITTGNAYSVVQLANFVNTNFINSLGFFGFINIFGDWSGDVGDKNAFVTPTPTPQEEQTTQSKTADDTSRESGGLLTVTQKNNVGEFVLPGDTVTFFVKTKNTGSGMVYGAKLHLYLMKDGKNLGGRDFDLGDIPVGKGSYLTTGFVLSKKAQGGLYTAHAVVDGTTGNDNAQVSASADSTFTIKAGEGEEAVLGTDTGNGLTPQLPVLGIKSNVKSANNTEFMRYLVLLSLLAGIYLFIRILRKRELFVYLVFRRVSFKIRLYALRMFLL